MAEAKPPDDSTETVLLTPQGTPPSGGAPGVAAIGAYRVERRLGQGGMGEVFLAWDDRLNRRVAIKRIRQDSPRVPNLHQRILQEARAAAGLSHPAIVQVHDLVEDASGAAIVMEYAEGRTLAEHLSGGPLDLPRALRLAREIAEGLAAAHAAGIVHRDLKAGNVIVTTSGHAKILDFGLARVLSGDPDQALTQQGVVIGTYHAMSPEQASGRPVDARSDLFSFGVLLYEMLTGRSPFRGENVLATLKRLAAEEPPPVAQIRPDVPARLSGLVERLLEKDPDGRPGSAAGVAAALEEIEAEISEDHRPPAPPRPQRMAAAALLAAVLAMSGTAWLLLHRPAEPLRVVVPEPIVKGADPRLGLAASGVLSSALSGLTSLAGVAPLDSRQGTGRDGSAVDMAKAAAADEILITMLEGTGQRGRVTLRRVQGSDGQILWSETFDVPLEPRTLRSLAAAVDSRLRQGYPGREPRPGLPTPGVKASDADYAAYLELFQRLKAGKTALEPELERLEKILATSPRFLEARITAAEVSLSLFTSTREISFRNRALAFLQGARELAPGDPRPLKTRFRIALEGDSPEVAQETLERLEKLVPGDPMILPLRAELAERLGRTEEALAHWRTAVERSPSWRNLYGLARLEGETGKVADSRRHFEMLLERSPGNLHGLAELARLEFVYGDLSRAERLYLELIAKSPSGQGYFVNLGFTRALLGRHEEAIEAYSQALAIDPDQVYANLNLADSKLALGKAKEAEALYAKVLRQLDRNRPPGGSPPDVNMIEAQCLARLGRFREAVEITRASLRQSPDDPDVLQSAALVYTLAGDGVSARVHARRALEKGIQPRFFDPALLSGLWSDPEFRALLARPPEGTGGR